MNKFFQVMAIALVFLFLLTACGKPPQEPQKPLTTNTSKQSTTATPPPIEFKDIKVTVDIDWNVKKGATTKYIVTIQNNSDKTFSGKVSIIPTTSRIMESFDVDILQLIPKEMKTIISFAEIKSDTKFDYRVNGSFSEFSNKTKLDYKTIKTLPGNGYMTFWIYTPNSNKDNLIAISKEMKVKYSSLKIGFQIRFFNKENPNEMAENIAAYALTNHLNLTKLTIFKNDEEINID